ncbi:MAG: hypothetical protein L0H70_00855 [Xanthomonadales bacterium]|nr:hypothetical protein [Xanthomonadales bacterium]
MLKPRQAMSIHLNSEQTERLLGWARKVTPAELEADIEPTCYYLEVSVHPCGNIV